MWLSVLCLFTAAGAGAAAAVQPQWTILAYLETQGGLTAAAEHYRLELSAAARSERLSLGILELPDEIAPLEGRQSFISAGGEPATTGVPLRGVRTGHLANLVATGIEALPAAHYALLIMGHGSGLVTGPSLGGMTPRELALELHSAAARTGRTLDVIGLDTCFGGSLEVAYELRGLCRYITAAPGLICSPGLNWREALTAKASADLSPALSLVAALVAAGMPHEEYELALLGLDMERIEAAVAGVAALTRSLRAELGALGPAIVFARSQARSWGARDELCDLRQFAVALEANVVQPEVKQASRELVVALDKLVVARWESGEGGPTGVGIYYPRSFEAVPETYMQSFALTLRTGWGAYLQEYWARIAGHLTGGAAIQ